MKNQDVLHLILPGLRREDQPEFYDFMGRCAARAEGLYTLELTADFPAALVRFDIELKPGAFNYDTLYCELSEYPGGQYVKTGPWDVALDPPRRMQAPTLDIYWRDEQYGNLWFEMPSPDDIRERRLGGVFALPFCDVPGQQTVRLVVPSHERSRLDFSMVEKITVRLDNRAIPAIVPRLDFKPDVPWLFLGDWRIEDLPKLKTGPTRQLWQRMAETTARYFETGQTPVRGISPLAGAAFMALVEGDKHWSFQKLVALLEERRRHNAFLDTGGKFMFFEADTGRHSEKSRWLMSGWNDYGFSWILLENACIYQWLKDSLPAELRQWLQTELIRYGRELYRFIVFQRQYAGAQGTMLNPHANVPQLTVTVLGAVLFRECAEATAWLNFGFGRLRETVGLMRDAIFCADDLYWAASWMYPIAELMLAITGEDHRNTPYFKMAPEALWRHHYLNRPEGFPILIRYFRRLLAACYGSQLDSAECRWYYRQLCAEDATANAEPLPVCYLDLLWHTDEPGRSPEESAKNRSILFSDASYALLQTNYESPRLSVTAQGGPFGKQGAYTLESYNGVWQGSLRGHGHYEVWMQGCPILRQLSSYRMSFRNGNFVAVDGDGFFLDGAYLLGRSDMSQVACLRRADLQETSAYLDFLNTRSYRPDLQMELSRRRFFFDPIQEWVVIIDDVVSRLDHEYSLILHANEIEVLGAGRFRCFGVDQDHRGADDAVRRVGPLHVQCLCDQPASCESAVGALVLTYTAGVTQVKGVGALSPDMRGYAPPLDRQIVCAVQGRRKTARFITVAGARELECVRDREALTIRTDRGERRLRPDDEKW